MVQSCFGLCQLPYGFAILPLRPPPPDLSVHLQQGLENLGVLVFGSVPPRMPLNQLRWAPLAPGFVDRCMAGEPVWVGNAGSVNGSARVRVTTDSQRSPRAGGSVVLQRSAGSPLLYASS